MPRVQDALPGLDCRAWKGRSNPLLLSTLRFAPESRAGSREMIARIAAEPHPFPVLGVSKKPAHDLQSEDFGLRTEWFPYTRDEPIIEGRARPLANDEPVNRGDEFGAN